MSVDITHTGLTHHIFMCHKRIVRGFNRVDGPWAFMYELPHPDLLKISMHYPLPLILQDVNIRSSNSSDPPAEPFTMLPDPETWSYPTMFFVEDEMFKIIDNKIPCTTKKDIYCTVKFKYYPIRYTLEIYRGVSSWYYTNLPLEAIARTPSQDPRETFIYHENFGKSLVSAGLGFFEFLESAAREIWVKEHKNCPGGHLYANIYITNHLTGRHVKYVTYKLCAGALVADFLTVVFKSLMPDGSFREIEDWQGLGQVSWSRAKFLTKTNGKVRVENFYDFKSASKSGITVEETGWFERKRHGWLIPIYNSGVCDFLDSAGGLFLGFSTDSAVSVQDPTTTLQVNEKEEGEVGEGENEDGKMDDEYKTNDEYETDDEYEMEHEGEDEMEDKIKGQDEMEDKVKGQDEMEGKVKGQDEIVDMDQNEYLPL